MSDCCDHAADAAKWRRVEYSIERAARKGYDLDPEDLLDLVAAPDSKES